MNTVISVPVPRLIGLEGLRDLFEVLTAVGYQVIGPVVQDDAIVLGELSSAAELPFGWGVRLEPGGYRLRRRADNAAFGHSAGPQNWKRFPPPPRYAFFGVRPCDLRAIFLQDRALAQPGSRYAGRRESAFIVAVNCTEPGETCCCASMNTGPGTGPGAGPGFDLALTELADEHGHRFLVDVSSTAGADIISRIDSEHASDAVVQQARSAVEAAADRMRHLDHGGLRELMAGVLGCRHQVTDVR